MKILRPTEVTKSIVSEIEKKIIDRLREQVYLPLVDALKLNDDILLNSNNALILALRSGRVYFSRGKFLGRFNATITKELRKLGATWNKKNKSFDIHYAKLPDDIRMGVASAEKRLNDLLDRLRKKLDKISPDSNIDFTKLIDKQIFDIDSDIKSQLKKIGIKVKFSEEEQAKISKEYTENMNYYIKKWTEGEIKDLRKIVEKDTLSGMRYEQLAGKIRKSYGVSKSKAKFLARQETHLLMVEMKKNRYLSVGATEYVWRNVVGSPNHPVRKRHKELNGKIFSWKKPPRVSENGQPVRYGHPGQDFNCRCQAIPIVRF